MITQPQPFLYNYKSDFIYLAYFANAPNYERGTLDISKMNPIAKSIGKV